MAENTKRSLFGLHGIFGVLISIVGLLVILITLMLMVIVVQRHSAVNPYDPSVIRDVNNLKMISKENKNFAFVDAEKKDK
jgi:hypothetical protein